MDARITPYEALLEPLERISWPRIQEEAAARGTEAIRRDQFVLLGSVGATLRDIVPDDSPADAMEEYAELVYHAYQFWSFGRRLYAVSPEALSQVTSPAYSTAGWILAAPPACYLQLPAQRVWARVAPESPYEPVDGCFVVVDDTEPAPGAGAHLRVQMVLGLRPERPGISLVSYRTDLEPQAVAGHADRPWREQGEPFANAIPGGELRNLHALTTTSELEALVLRLLHYLDRNPARLVAREPVADADDGTLLPWTEVRGA